MSGQRLIRPDLERLVVPRVDSSVLDAVFRDVDSLCDKVFSDVHSEVVIEEKDVIDTIFNGAYNRESALGKLLLNGNAEKIMKLRGDIAQTVRLILDNNGSELRQVQVRHNDAFVKGYSHTEVRWDPVTAGRRRPSTPVSPPPEPLSDDTLAFAEYQTVTDKDRRDSVLKLVCSPDDLIFATQKTVYGTNGVVTQLVYDPRQAPDAAETFVEKYREEAAASYEFIPRRLMRTLYSDIVYEHGSYTALNGRGVKMRQLNDGGWLFSSLCASYIRTGQKDLLRQNLSWRQHTWDELLDTLSPNAPTKITHFERGSQVTLDNRMQDVLHLDIEHHSADFADAQLSGANILREGDFVEVRLGVLYVPPEELTNSNIAKRVILQSLGYGEEVWDNTKELGQFSAFGNPVQCSKSDDVADRLFYADMVRDTIAKDDFTGYLHFTKNLIVVGVQNKDKWAYANAEQTEGYAVALQTDDDNGVYVEDDVHKMKRTSVRASSVSRTPEGRPGVKLANHVVLLTVSK